VAQTEDVDVDGAAASLGHESHGDGADDAEEEAAAAMEVSSPSALVHDPKIWCMILL